MNFDKFEVKIEILDIAERTDDEAESDIETLVDVEPMHDVEESSIKASKASWSNGHIRRKWYRGICYCQMYCNGQWLYFSKRINGRIVYKTCGGRGWTVNCAGNTFILRC